MRRRVKVAVVICFLLSGFSSKAQVNDAQAWLNLNVEKKITPRFSATVTGEVRLDENYSEVGTILCDLGLSYRFNDRLKAAISYRYSLKRRLDDTYEPRHSWYADGYYRERFKPVELVFRLRYQARYDEAYTSAESTTPTNHLRTKLTAKLDLNRKYLPYLFGELFFRTSPSKYQPMDQFRAGAGVEYSFNRRNKIDLNYFISRETGVNNPETDFVIGFGYFYLF